MKWLWIWFLCFKKCALEKWSQTWGILHKIQAFSQKNLAIRVCLASFSLYSSHSQNDLFSSNLKYLSIFPPCDRSLQEVTGCYITGSVYLFAGGKNKAKGVVLKNSRENIPSRRRAVTALELLPLCFDDNIHHCKLSLLFSSSKHLITLKLFFLVRPH